MTSNTLNSPVVNVPVLSNTITSALVVNSKASLFLTSNPRLAPKLVLRDTTKGIARPKACGQAITNVVTVKITAVGRSAMIIQASRAIKDTTTAM